MRVLCVFGRHNYGDPARGEGYEYSNFVPALESLGHEVHLFDSWDRSLRLSARELNQALLHTVEDVRPDVVFSVMVTYETWLETWEILRDSGIAATVNWTTDDSWKYSQFSRFLAPAFHAFTTTYPGCLERYRQDGFDRVLLTQWAASGVKLTPPKPAVECRYSTSFVGTAHGRRRRWVERLRSLGLQIECFGYGWPRGPVAAADIGDIVRDSVISLNFSNSPLQWEGLRPNTANQVKARTFEVPGAGGFLLTEAAEGVERYFVPGREVAVFSTLEELAEKIRYYVGHPAERDTVAEAGHRRTRAEHTYERRLREVLEFAVRCRDAFLAARSNPAPQRIDWARFERTADVHTLPRRLALLKRVLTTLCSAIWGSPRGDRAARRLVFEVSWRVCGARTYSAAGWPGRMFYLER